MDRLGGDGVHDGQVDVEGEHNDDQAPDGCVDEVAPPRLALDPCALHTLALMARMGISAVNRIPMNLLVNKKVDNFIIK
jgi:hypothetical protein